MALGRPIVATRVGGMPEAIGDRESGWLVPADDVAGLGGALRVMLDDPALAARLGEAARLRHRACYGIEQMATSWRLGWERVLANRGES
jgi:glycosyltransferase involved in cell wall biosynthesis